MLPMCRTVGQGDGGDPDGLHASGGGGRGGPVGRAGGRPALLRVPCTVPRPAPARPRHVPARMEVQGTTPERTLPEWIMRSPNLKKIYLAIFFSLYGIRICRYVLSVTLNTISEQIVQNYLTKDNKLSRVF